HRAANCSVLVATSESSESVGVGTSCLSIIVSPWRGRESGNGRFADGGNHQGEIARWRAPGVRADSRLVSTPGDESQMSQPAVRFVPRRTEMAGTKFAPATSN